MLAAIVRELGPGTPCLQTVFSPGVVAIYFAEATSGACGLLRDEPGLQAASLGRIAELLVHFNRESADTDAMAPEE